MLVRFQICERVSQLREMDCRNVKGNMRVHCPTAIFCFSTVREKYRKKNIKEAMLICARGYTGVCIAQACKRCCIGQKEITVFFFFLAFPSVCPQSHQKKAKAASVVPSFLFVRVHLMENWHTPVKPEEKQWAGGREEEIETCPRMNIASHFKSSHHVLKPEGSVFLYYKANSEMCYKMIRNKQTGKMSDELLLISSWACLVPFTLLVVVVSVERAEVAVNLPVSSFFMASSSPRIWWTIVSATEKRQNSTLSSDSLATCSTHIQA